MTPLTQRQASAEATGAGYSKLSTHSWEEGSRGCGKSIIRECEVQGQLAPPQESAEMGWSWEQKTKFSYAGRRVRDWGQFFAITTGMP